MVGFLLNLKNLLFSFISKDKEKTIILDDLLLSLIQLLLFTNQEKNIIKMLIFNIIRIRRSSRTGEIFANFEK